MGSVADIGLPGQPLSTPPLTVWQAAVRDALDGSDVPVANRLAPTGVTYTGTRAGAPPAASYVLINLTAWSGGWGAPGYTSKFLAPTGGIGRVVPPGRYRFTGTVALDWSGDGVLLTIDVMAALSADQYFQPYVWVSPSTTGINRAWAGVNLQGVNVRANGVGIHLPSGQLLGSALTSASATLAVEWIPGT